MVDSFIMDHSAQWANVASLHVIKVNRDDAG